MVPTPPACCLLPQDAPLPCRPLPLLLQGMSPADQAEVEANKVAVYLNLAAVHMAVQVVVCVGGWGVGGGGVAAG